MIPDRRVLPWSTAEGNWLLAGLLRNKPVRFAQLEGALKTLTFEPGTVLLEGGRTPAALYFVDSGLVSVLAHTASGELIEAGFVGLEGVTNAGWLLGRAPSSYSFVAQVPVTCRRLDVVDMRRLWQGGTPHPLDAAVGIYAQYLLEQVVQRMICARFHNTTERLAKLLLLMTYRMGHNLIPRTHESLAPIVGAPRSVITESVGELRQAGCIEANRGRVIVLDPAHLRTMACECLPRDEARLTNLYRRLVGDH